MTGGAFLLWRIRMTLRRKALRQRPLEDRQRAILKRYFPLFKRIPAPERQRLEGLIHQFLAEKKFLGSDGIHVTDDMRLLIAAQACILVVNHRDGAPYRLFPHLSTIIIYPAAFRHKAAQKDGHAHTHSGQIRAGESWMRGPVVLAWDHTRAGAENDQDGHNVVIHEFAHQLDNQTGVIDGAPLLSAKQSDTDWARTFQAAYARHQHALAHNVATLLDPYGATNPAEFFAVSVETFFERGAALKRAEADLYDALKTFFRVDPASWQ